MFKIESNLGEVVKQLERELHGLENQLEDFLLKAAMDAIVVVADRIQQRGENTAGQQMVSKSPERLAAYSKAYARYRQARGRQIGRVDFTLEGGLMGSFQIIEESRREVIVGFVAGEMNDIAEWLEQYFGPVFYLSNAEKKSVLENLATDVLSTVG